MAGKRMTKRKPASVDSLLRRHPFVSRVVKEGFRRGAVELADSAGLDHPEEIALGAKKQLEWLASRSSPITLGEQPYRILDVDAGVGRVGLSIACGFPPRAVRVALSSRDRIAAALLGWTSAITGLAPSVEVLEAGPGYGPARSARSEAFDLVLVRLRDGLMRRAIRELLLGAGTLLKDDGLVAFTHSKAMREDVAAVFARNDEQKGWVEVVREVKGPAIDLRVWKIRHALPDPRLEHDPLFPWRVDGPSHVTIGARPNAPFVTVMSVAEGDAVARYAELLLERLEAESPREALATRERVLVLEPAHGRLALHLIDRREPREIAMLSRDTLSIAVSIRNVDLARERWRVDRRVGLVMPAVRQDLPFLPAANSGYDVIVGALATDQGAPALAATLDSLRDALAPEALALVAIAKKALPVVKKAASQAKLRVDHVAAAGSDAVLTLRAFARNRPRVR